MEDSIIRKIYQIKEINEQNRLNKLNSLKQNLDKLYNGSTNQQKTTIGNTYYQSTIQTIQTIKTEKECIW